MIKKILKVYLFSLASLYIVNQIASGMVFSQGVKTLLLTALGLAISSFIAKPIINILLLPLNLITFGLFRWISGAVALYLVSLVVPGFKIIAFNFSGFSNAILPIPAFSLVGFLAIIAFSFAISIISSFLHWLFS